MRKLFVLAALLVTFTSQAQWRMDNLDNNTLIHASVGVGVGNAAAIFGKTPKQRFVFGLVSGIVAGITKEVYDSRQGQYAQTFDVAATAAGGVVGAMMVNWAIKRNEKYKKRKIYRYRKCKM